MLGNDKQRNNNEEESYFDDHNADHSTSNESATNKSEPELDHDYVEEEFPEVTKNLSKVAASKGSTIAILIAICVFSGIIIYNMFAPSKKDLEDKRKQEKISSVPVVTPPKNENESILVPQVPVLPEAPVLAAPTLPPTNEKTEHKIEPPKPVTQAPPQLPLTPEDNAHAVLQKPQPLSTPGITPQQVEARLKSGMSVFGGGSRQINNNLIDSAGGNYNDIPISGQQVQATRIGDLSRVVAEGKLIDAILESAINTDLPGLIRGIVSHDVYAENGVSLVIPKGSRLIGTYDSSVAIGQQRVQITWTRLIRPDGIDIALNSLATDPIGTAGTAGDVNNKYVPLFAGTVMLSMLKISLAGWNDVLNSKEGVTQDKTVYIMGTNTTQNSEIDPVTHDTVPPGGPLNIRTTIPGDKGTRPLQSAAREDAVNNLGDVGKKIIENQMKNLKPTITIPQGTKIKVFITKDLVFPKFSSLNNSIKVVQ